MVDAAQIQYRQEFIKGFERRQSLLRDTVTTEAVIKGNQAVFLVSDSGQAKAVTRGVNGRIPARGDSNEQYTVTLTESHDLVEKTNFNIFASQSNQREIMYQTTMDVINRSIDDKIIAALSAGTNGNAAPVAASEDNIFEATTTLFENFVPNDGNVFALVTPAFYNKRLMKINSFASADYVSRRPLEEGAPTEGNGFKQWLNIKWIMHTGLAGMASANATCYFYHKSAIGHAADTQGMQHECDYENKHDLSWCRATIYDGAILLQNEGVYKFQHNDDL